MKFVFVLGILCAVALVVSAGKSQKKREYQPETNEDIDLRSEFKEHNYKKYEKDHKHHHHHKYHPASDKANYKTFGKHHEQEKKQKHVPKSAPQEVPAHEAELQADVKTSKKHLKEQHMKHEKEDLHLQDLAFEVKETPEAEQPNKSPHQYQRGHHKANQHFTHHNKKASKHEKNTQMEEKLFDDQAPKESALKSSPPVLEDSFEALNDEPEAKKHSKKASKHKKAYEKVKKDKKEKKPKKDKKEKKQKDTKEKQKW